jgi:hypothetical protein
MFITTMLRPARRVLTGALVAAVATTTLGTLGAVSHAVSAAPDHGHATVSAMKEGRTVAPAMKEGRSIVVRPAMKEGSKVSPAMKEGRGSSVLSA